jgi:hypothetical protein
VTRTDLRVRITVQGRIGPALQAAFEGLDVRVVPRHTVVVGACGPHELLALLEALGQRGLEVDRITQGAPARGDDS